MDKSPRQTDRGDQYPSPLLVLIPTSQASECCLTMVSANVTCLDERSLDDR